VTTEEFEELPATSKVDIKELELDEVTGKPTKGDSRSPKYTAKYGTTLGAEVEALDSQELCDRVENWILSYIDKDKLEQSRAIEHTEQEKLAELKL
jgi:hypothetical protein